MRLTRVFLAPLLLQLASAAPTAEEVLRDMGAAYKKVTRLHVVVSRQDEMTSLRGSAVGSTEYEFAASGLDKVRAAIRREGDASWFVSDGSTTWRASGKKWSKETLAAFDSEDEAKDADAASAGTFRGSVQAFVYTRFLAMARHAKNPEFVKEDWYKLGKQQVPVYVVRLATEEAKHELWIDRERHLVMQSIQTSAPKTEQGAAKLKVVMKTKSLATGAAVEDSLFAFTAPKGWSETESVMLPLESRLQMEGLAAPVFGSRRWMASRCRWRPCADASLWSTSGRRGVRRAARNSRISRNSAPNSSRAG